MINRRQVLSAGLAAMLHGPLLAGACGTALAANLRHLRTPASRQEALLLAWRGRRKPARKLSRHPHAT